MLLKIISVRKKPFKNSDGEAMDYFWTKAQRTDGVVIQFGGMVDYTSQVDVSLELPIEKIEFSNGKLGYKDTSVLNAG